jgi:hypothetical protein
MGQLTEVIVTAERVESSESRTPISMEVLQQQELLTGTVNLLVIGP